MKKIILLAMLIIGWWIPIKAQTNTPAPTNFIVFLRGSNEVPPNNSTSVETGYFTLDGNVLSGSFSVVNSFLAPTNAGIYGPAQPGQTGELIFEYDLSNYSIAVPNGGGGGIWYYAAFELTPEQMAQLQAGLWYLSIKTAVFPNGEVRGQICPLTPDCDCDGDGVPDKDDDCLNTPPGAIVDANGCSIEQLCPCSGPWKNHKQYVKSVREQAFRFWRERRISVHERNAIVKEAEKSNCGNSTHPTRHPFPGPLSPAR
jgi:hypothetical protein